MSQLQPILVAGAWRQAEAVDQFTAINPRTRQPLEARFPVSGRADLLAAIAAGAAVAPELAAAAPGTIANFLEAYASLIDANRGELAALAHAETGLAVEPRLNSTELPRTIDQLRQAAQAVRDCSWTRPTIDRKLNIRSLLAPLSAPVVVFGPNNFPFAYNAVAGGDFASAIAARNPVIAKAHPSQPATSQRLAELALQALGEAGLPAATVQMLYHLPPELGLELVAHPAIGAAAFTGSRRGGLALKAAADAAGKPIYLELSSVNPVVLLAGALDERPGDLATEFAASCTLGGGQFCTNPGLVLLAPSARSKEFIAHASFRFGVSPTHVLLNEGVLEGLQASLQTLREHGATVVTGGEVVDDGFRVANTLLQVSGAQFLASPAALQTEAFGASSLVVTAESLDELLAIIATLEGNLTGSIYSHSGDGDDAAYAQVAAALRPKVGRLLNDKMPTGVAVTAAMNHGGPYPATGHPGWTAVGFPAAITRFAALQCYDNVRPQRLPAELQDANPLQIWRLVDGTWSCG
ncbi:MAG: aldehyde dehydrogenase family protein [Herpetosiphonaceae bacterium]|nr:aldehyde dehydrogenase family protein [Herpetosiphonaceae bacterium]